MLRNLLFLSAGAVCLSAAAIVEPDSYESYNDITCTNLYNISRAYSPDEFAATPMAEFNNKTRSMVCKDGKLYIAESRTMLDGEESNDFAHLIVVDQLTGDVEARTQLTLPDGAPVKGLLCANQIGIDDFGNLWFIGLTGNTESTPWKLYHIKDLAKGTVELIAELKVPADEAEAFGRHDYYDLVGDVTGVQAGTVVMSPVASGGDTYVVGFERAQGSDEWEPHMSDYYASAMSETFPADQITWDGAPVIRIIRDDDHSGTMFYIDAFVTYPTPYNTDGTMIDSFAGSVDLVPQTNSNGVYEFHFADRDFLAYTYTDYDKGVGTQVRIVEMGPDQSLSDMTLAWDLPGNGLGTVSDSGTRMMGICPNVVTDEDGNEGCYLSLYKCNGGLATYLLATPGFKASVSDIVTDAANAPSMYYNLMGQPVMAPVKGQFLIERKGSKIEKIIF